ncbi:MAG TPA: glycosyltransferase [Gaiellaceae bacterium]|jgi:glycosyltransferase involved in cell wall biosynthesis
MRHDEETVAGLRVKLVGPAPVWLEAPGAAEELRTVVLERDGEARTEGAPQIVQLAASAFDDLPRVRRAFPESVVVLDLTGEGDAELDRRRSRRARDADAVLAGSERELADLRRRLGETFRSTAAVDRPVDLQRFEPADVLAEEKGRGRDLRRFRRFHRLAGPLLLFAGPYTAAGGLDVLLEAVYALRASLPELRVAAIPHGPTEPGYRDRCEMRALGLGHHGIVEWTPAEEEVPFWYATAAVVCSLPRDAGSTEPPKRAAAAARPFVGTRGSFQGHVEDGVTGTLLESADAQAAAGVLRTLIEDEATANAYGRAARARAEGEWSPATAARALRQVWQDLLGR